MYTGLGRSRSGGSFPGDRPSSDAPTRAVHYFKCLRRLPLLKPAGLLKFYIVLYRRLRIRYSCTAPHTAPQRSSRKPCPGCKRVPVLGLSSPCIEQPQSILDHRRYSEEPQPIDYLIHHARLGIASVQGED